MKINENYIVFPDGTDESADFRGETFTTDSGETMYFAPLRVQTDDDLKTFGVGKEARWTLPFGKSSVKYKVLYFLTPREELAEEFWEKINTQHSQDNRKRRCMIPGKLKPLIVCPDCNSCAHCPYPEYRDKHEAREISYNDKLNAQKITPRESPEIRNAVRMARRYSKVDSNVLIIAETGCGKELFLCCFYCSSSPLLRMTASAGQSRKQSPQCRQFSCRIT